MMSLLPVRRAMLLVALYPTLSLAFCDLALAQVLQTPLALNGSQLFEHEWTIDDENANRDGIGPLFNATSCRACHHLGGIGGGGPNENNVFLVAVHWDKLNSDTERDRARRVARQIHPQLLDLPAIVVHRFSILPPYESWRLKTLGFKVGEPILSDDDKARLYKSLATRIRNHRGPVYYQLEKVPFVLTQRNTPALFGAGLIDRIDESAIRELAAEKRGHTLGISGRVAVANAEDEDPLADSRDNPAQRSDELPPLVGKFGWKGQTATLAEFVVGACANELGLQTAKHPQPHWPQGARVQQGPTPNDDLPVEQCRKLVRFVEQLPQPVSLKKEVSSQSTIRALGETIFKNLGCAHCHVPTLDGVDGLFSDLLLHDMGRELADPIPANPSTDSIKPKRTKPQMGWGVAEIPVASLPRKQIEELSREWRTPPLWGVANSSPYLHDGRAETLQAAISWHAGEALAVRQAYDSLPQEGKTAVLAFLQGLVSPNDALATARVSARQRR